MKNFSKLKFSLGQQEGFIFKTKEQLLAELKQNPAFEALNLEFNFTQAELEANYINFVDYLAQQNTPNLLYEIKITRSSQNKLVFEKSFVPSLATKEYLLANNLLFTSISQPINQLLLSDLENISQNKNYDLYKYKTTIEQMFANNTPINQIKGAYFEGSNNSKRSELLSAFANTFAFQNFKVAYLNINYFEDEVKKTINNPEYQLDYLIEKIKNIDVLFLDELGYRQYSNWFLDSVLVKILDYRMLNRKTTFIGSYCTMANLAATLAPKKNQNAINPNVIAKLCCLIQELCVRAIWTE